MMKIVLASGNLGKLKEMQMILASCDIELVAQSEYQVSEVAETGLSFVENALIKARHAAQQTSLPAIADDSGVCVNALAGEPGIYSARYAGESASSQDNLQKLLSALESTPSNNRTAYFYCAIVMVQHAADPTPIIALGQWTGKILTAPQGTGGFGYDPIFQPNGVSTSAAELTAAEKNKMSHRGQALQALIKQLKAT